ncbi:MAG: 2'-5' RNA ligase family protein [archaeon]
MRYDIRVILKGNIKTFQDRLVKNTAQKFNETTYYHSKNPPHLTLKYSFETPNIKRIEETMRKITHNSKNGTFSLTGFGSFAYPKENYFVLYSKFALSRSCHTLQHKVIKVLKDEGIEIQKRDQKWVPHATICFTSSKENFNKIRNYLQKMTSSQA